MFPRSDNCKVYESVGASNIVNMQIQVVLLKRNLKNEEIQSTSYEKPMYFTVEILERMTMEWKYKRLRRVTILRVGVNFISSSVECQHKNVVNDFKLKLILL